MENDTVVALRQGARRLLAQGVEAEVADFLDRADADLKSRGLSVAPELAIGDGALGFWKGVT